MKLNNNNQIVLARKYFAVVITFVISLIVIEQTDDVLAHILSMLALCFVAVCVVKFDILHPYCWFSGFFGIYSVGYPILYYIGFPSFVGYTKNTMIYQLVALFVSLLLITPVNHTKKIGNSNLNLKKFIISNTSLNKYVYWIMLGLITVAAVLVSRMGFSGKDDIYKSGNIVLIAIFRLPLIIALFYTIQTVSYYIVKNKYPIRQSFLTLFCLLLITIFSGERDFVFRFLIMGLFVLFFLGKVNFKQLIIIILFMVPLVPLSAMYKYYFLGGDIGNQADFGLLYSVIAGEFESATRNLQMLVNNSSQTLGSKGYILLINDVVGVFNSNIQSSVSWFNETFYPNDPVEYGFTLVGEGYIVDGMMGICVVFSIMALIVRWMYKNAFKSIYFFSGYIYFITIMIYAMRGDLGTVYSALFKQIFFMILFFKWLEHISKKQIKNNEKLLVRL